MKLDRFDIVNLAAACILLAAAAFFMLGGRTEASRQAGPASAPARGQAPAPDPELRAGLAKAKGLLEAGQVKESVLSLSALAAANPAEPDTHALLGQACSKLQDYPASMKEFRLALTLDPSYVDGKSPKFIGGRIKAAVREGMEHAKAGLRVNPDDAQARAELKDAYYLTRMLAGGCE